MSQDALLLVEGLKVIFPTDAGIIKAVEGIDLAIHPGECLALVGESGCGKSVSSLAILGLLGTPPALVRAQTIRFDGQNLQALNEQQMAQIRGKDIAMIFQDALTALNPVMSIGRQLDEVFLKHCGMNKTRRRELHWALRAWACRPRAAVQQFPHQLRRDAPAGADRHGLRGLSQADHRR